MAAGLGFKDFVTGEVLTAADVDGYLMQGVWVFASAAARDAAVTAPQEGNFAYLKDTNVTTYYTGSAWANLDTTGMTNLMTTTGDTIYSSSGSTPARLGIGSTGQILTVAGGVPTWATASSGGMTLLSTTTLSGATTTISVGSGYYSVFGLVYGVTNNTADGELYIAINNETTSFTGSGVARYPSTSYLAGVSSGYLSLSQGYSTKRTDANNAWTFQIYNYTSTTNHKPIEFFGTYINNDSAAQALNMAGGYRSNSAITSLVFSATGGNFSAGTVLLYGVK